MIGVIDGMVVAVIHGTRSTVQISSGTNGPDLFSLIAISHFTISRLWEIAAFMLWTPDSRDPKIFSRQIHGTRSTVQISSGTNGPDLFSLITISHFAISRLWEIVAFMLRTPDSRVPKIFSRQINGTRSTVQNSFSTNGPDPLSLFMTSDFEKQHPSTSRLPIVEVLKSSVDC
jgi:hypothetical protein